MSRIKKANAGHDEFKKIVFIKKLSIINNIRESHEFLALNLIPKRVTKYQTLLTK